MFFSLYSRIMLSKSATNVGMALASRVYLINTNLTTIYQIRGTNTSTVSILYMNKSPISTSLASYLKFFYSMNAKTSCLCDFLLLCYIYILISVIQSQLNAQVFILLRFVKYECFVFRRPQNNGIVSNETFHVGLFMMQKCNTHK